MTRQKSSEFFRKYAWGVLAFLLGVIVWGAYVRATGSGAGCGRHWPLCNGQVIPQAVRVQTWVEFSHRASSGLSLVAVLSLTGWAFRVFPRCSFVRRSAGLAGVAIIVEALVGAALVLLRLVEHNQSVDRAVSIAIHLVNTSFLIGAVTLTVFGASRARPRFLPLDLTHRKRAWFFLIGFLCLGVTGALTALGDTLFRPVSLAAGIQGDFRGGSHFLERLRVIHPMVAVVWVSFLLPWLQGLGARSKRLRLCVRWETGFILLNLTLGLVNVLTLAPIGIQLAHLLVANLAWIGLLWICAEVGSSHAPS